MGCAAFGKLAASIEDILEQNEVTDTAVDVARLNKACARALKSHEKENPSLAIIQQGYEALARAQTTAGLRRAAALIDGADTAGTFVTDAEQFRKGCG